MDCCNGTLCCKGGEAAGEAGTTVGIKLDIVPEGAVVEAASERIERRFFQREEGDNLDLRMRSGGKILDFAVGQDFPDERFGVVELPEPFEFNDIDAGAHNHGIRTLLHSLLNDCVVARPVDGGASRKDYRCFAFHSE